MPDVWLSTHFGENPLVGTIHAGDGTPVAAPEFARAVAEARYVLAGETHDNADHHLIQARIVEAMAAAGDRPAVVFEMIAVDLQPALDAYLASPARSAEGFGAAVQWAERGWPDYAIYRPVVAAALAAGLAIRAADLPRETIRRIGREGTGALSAAEIERLSLGGPMPAAEAGALSATLKASHCGMLPDAAVAPMLTVQRARDGALADAVMAAAKEAGEGKAMLVAGSGHVRRDWAVPAVIDAREVRATEGGATEGRATERTAPGSGSDIVSIAMMEVSEGEDDPKDYGLTADDPAPYDYILFTPRGDISDPCEGMAEAMKAPAK